MLFSKMHGLGNDFIMINNLTGEIELTGEQIKFLCDRKYGVGADGLILVDSSKHADFKMSYYNADGNQVEMCGNGIRCFAKYIYDNNISNSEELLVETLAGIKETRVMFKNSLFQGIRVNMGPAEFNGNDIPVNIDKKTVIDETLIYKDTPIKFSCVSMGNPHVVIDMEDINNYSMEEIGSYIENHPLFPHKTNVNFYKVKDKNNIDVITWERGVGFTLACGTGTCGTVAILHRKNLTNNKVSAHLPGGDLIIEINDDVFMTGNAVSVYTGNISLNEVK